MGCLVFSWSSNRCHHAFEFQMDLETDSLPLWFGLVVMGLLLKFYDQNLAASTGV